MSNMGCTNFSTPGPNPAQVEQVTVAPSQPSGTKPRDKYKLLIYKLGIAEVVISGVCILLWLVTIIMAVTAPPYCYDWGDTRECDSIEFEMTYVSSGLWCPILLIVSGAFGIRIKTRPTVAMYKTNMILSIVSSVIMSTMVLLSGIAAGSYEAYRYRAIKVPHTLLAVLGFSAVVISIVHAAFCCAGTCCRHRRNYGAVMYTAPPQQYVQLPNGQLMLVQAQPMLPQNYPATVHMMPPGAVVYPTASVSFPGMSSQASVPQSAAAQTKQQEAILCESSRI